jgi:tetraacyldisaccharide 4'-kinase
MYQTILKKYQAPVFIISIGNLTAGGSGKTPFTIYLAELLHAKGIKTAVSHRGYKSGLENAVTLISDRQELLPEADQAGDEAWLISNRLRGVPVVTGKNRTEAVKLLCASFPDLDCIILDDSFQHLKVKHDLDIVIISNETVFGNGFVLPAGYLREPLCYVRKADLLIINARNETDPIRKPIAGLISRTGMQYFKGFYRQTGVFDFNGKAVPNSGLAGERIMLLAGIGNPGSFNATALQMKAEIAERVYLPDHCDYSSAELRQNILETFSASGATWILTTEKDYAKLRHYKEFSSYLLVLIIGFNFGDAGDDLSGFITDMICSSGSKS